MARNLFKSPDQQIKTFMRMQAPDRQHAIPSLPGRRLNGRLGAFQWPSHRIGDHGKARAGHMPPQPLGRASGQGHHSRRLWIGPAPQAPPHIRSEEHTSELQSLMRTSYAVFCLKKKTEKHRYTTITTFNSYHNNTYNNYTR